MIVEANETHIHNLTHLGLLLWPEHHFEELKEDFMELMKTNNNKFYLYYLDHDYIGFIHLSIRNDYVEGSTSSPVAYVEGIYVKPDFRRQGISRMLIAAGEQWGKSVGCIQIASDIEHDNIESYDFHLGVGFKEANRLIAFIKDI